MYDEYLYTHNSYALQVDSQEELNRFLDEHDKIERHMDVRWVSIDSDRSPDCWLGRWVKAKESSMQEAMLRH